MLILVSEARPARIAFLQNTWSMESANMHMATNEKDTKKKKAFILGEEEQNNNNKVSFFSSSTLDKL